MSWELLHFADESALANAAAEQWLTLLAAREAGRVYTVALSGGRIAKVFFAAVARLGKERGTDFANVHFFWADERCVGPDDPESNYGVARALLLDPLGIPAGQIHRLLGEAPEPEALAQANAELGGIAFGDGRGQPVFDLIFLGMGEEGHTASLFPGESSAVMEGPEVYRAVTTPKPPPRRITLGYAPLAAARQVWMLASGRGKEAALRASLDAADATPFGRVLHTRAMTRIFTELAGFGG